MRPLWPFDPASSAKRSEDWRSAGQREVGELSLLLHEALPDIHDPDPAERVNARQADAVAAECN
jgi:hypothetical protein